ncbi:hypothetical protein CMI39_00050 [Candidatus Pacearchaeota archaeon]|jgi:hypothetical protein|nr:hypothetical protein [Candidatus Pacearchaeota archaeon]|tara:strand:- start:3120 stop:3338 length:219 start_codon:yes stop_codon:yes gene_type:complete
MKEDKFDEEYLLKIYKKGLDPCEVYRCNNISKCNIGSKDKRKEIIKDPAKITFCKDYEEISVDFGSPYPLEL